MSALCLGSKLQSQCIFLSYILDVAFTEYTRKPSVLFATLPNHDDYEGGGEVFASNCQHYFLN